MPSLTHLHRLEAESIQIFREAVAEFERPVMLYSIGKDCVGPAAPGREGVLPAPPPFPLLHVDTTWKFRAMYAFRDQHGRAVGVDLIVHLNPEASSAGINPFDHGSAAAHRHHEDRGPEAGAGPPASTCASAAPAATRRSPAPRSGSSRSATPSTAGTRKRSARNCGTSTTRASSRARACGCSRCRTGPSSTSGCTSTASTIPIVPLYFAAERPVVERDGALIMVDDDRMPVAAG